MKCAYVWHFMSCALAPLPNSRKDKGPEKEYRRLVSKSERIKAKNRTKGYLAGATTTTYPNSR